MKLLVILFILKFSISSRQKLSSKKVGNINIFTLVVFWLAYFGLDVSQNCWIYPPSWNEILIYVAAVF